MDINPSNVIMDASAAKDEIERVNREQPIINRKNRIWNTVVFILIFGVIFVSASFAILHLFAPSTETDYPPMVIAICTLFLLLAKIWSIMRRDVLPKHEWYSANAKYYLMTNGHHVLECKLLKQYSSYVIQVTMEDDKHVVTTSCMECATLYCVIKTNISSRILHLPDGKVYVPYTKQNKTGC